MNVKIENSFISKITIDNNSGCWNWNRGLFRDGYGAFWNGSKTVRTHRFSYRYFRGKIPEGFCVCHRCDNPKCVNPNHLFLGTALDNERDKIKKNRRNNIGAKGESHGLSKLTEDQVREIRKIVASGKLSQNKTAKLFGVDSGLVNGIVHRKHWKHI